MKNSYKKALKEAQQQLRMDEQQQQQELKIAYDARFEGFLDLLEQGGFCYALFPGRVNELPQVSIALRGLKWTDGWAQLNGRQEEDTTTQELLLRVEAWRKWRLGELAKQLVLILLGFVVLKGAWGIVLPGAAVLSVVGFMAFFAAWAYRPADRTLVRGLKL